MPGRRGLFIACAWGLMAMAGSLAALEPPRVLLGDAHLRSTPLGVVVEMGSEFTQIRLSPSLVATAGKGTLFEIHSPLIGGATGVLQVIRGELILIDEQRDHAMALPAGGQISYVTAAAGGTGRSGGHDGPGRTARGRGEAHARRRAPEGWQAGLVANYAMIRQQDISTAVNIPAAEPAKKMVLPVIKTLLSFGGSK